jgi:uncharacterized tellurite resistance protein B-like protein
MSVLDWLGLGGPAGDRGGEGDVLGRIVRELDAMEPGAARHLALFAFLLSRVANVDQQVSDEETRAMGAIVETYGGVTAAQAALVVELAKAQHRQFGATQGFLAAREFRDAATEDQKRDLVHCLFAVSAADDSISVEEEEAIREICRELLLTNDEYLAIRSAYRDKRSVLKR